MIKSGELEDTAKKALELSQKASDYKYAFDNMLEGIQIHDFDWRYIYVNEALVSYSKYSREEMLGFTIMEKYPGIEQTALFKTIERCMTTRVAKHLETEFIFPDGTIAHFELSIQPIPEGVFILSIDRTEQYKAREKLLKVNHLYAFISQVNQDILHVKDEETLFRNACRIAIEFGKFRMAWVGMYKDDCRINLIEQNGIPEEDVKLFMNTPYVPDGPQDRVLKTGSYFVCNDIEHNLDLESWKPFAAMYGIRSVMLMPIWRSGHVIGTFNLYSTELDFAGEEETGLLIKITDNISFALDLFEKTQKQHEMENQVNENEKRFRALIEKSNDMITLSKVDGTIIYGSPSITKLFGYTAEEIPGSIVFDFIHPDDNLLYTDKRAGLLKMPGASVYQQMRLKNKNGDWIWCEVNVTNLLHDPGIHAMVSNFRDISEKKRSEERIDFDKNNLDALINNTMDLMWSVDTDFKLITFNQPFYEIIKLVSGVELKQGDSVFSAVLSPEQLERFKIVYTRAFSGESFTEIEHIETPIESWSEISYCPIRKGNEVIGTACHSRDITAVKTAEINIIKSEERYRQIVETSQEGIWLIDENNKTVFVNKRFSKIFGYSAEEMMDKSNFDLMDDEGKAAAREKIERRKLGIAENFELVYIGKNGKKIWVNVSASPIMNDNGKYQGALAMLTDITERKSADMEKEKMTGDLIRHNQDLEQFSYIISHNLRAPVANIIGIASALDDPELNNEDKGILTKGLHKSVENLENIVNDLGYILQVRNEINQPNEKIHFSALVEDIKISIKNLVDIDRINITYDFSEIDEMITIKGYLYSIFYNLISNSIKYRQHLIPCIINISSRIVNDRIELIFADNGMGIDLKSKGDQIFGLYKRFHTNIEGKGIGLFMVKTQVETLGGEISVLSEVNKGTEFRIEFNILEHPDHKPGAVLENVHLTLDHLARII